MQSLLLKFSGLFNQLVRKRYAFALLLLLAAGVLYVSEKTYRETTSTLRGGIALTDQRVQTASLLQLLTDLDAAEFGFRVSGHRQYQAYYEDIKRRLPAVQAAVNGFLISQGAEGEKLAREVAEFAQRKLDAADRAQAEARTLEVNAPADIGKDTANRAGTQALRTALLQQLDQAASRQQQARVSIYDALLVNRVTVGSLTLMTLISLLLFLKQLKRQDRERSQERERLEVEVQRRTSQLTELARHFQSVREDERSRIARELHDELGALLTVAKLEIARARSKSGDPDELLERLGRVTESINKGIALKRRIIEDLTPSALTHLGLTIALQNLCHDMSTSLGIPVILSTVNFSLSIEAKLAVYRFVQEALTNVGKYAAATEVKVTLSEGDGTAIVTVQDDGAGFDMQRTRVGQHGLSGMRFRAESLGGSMTIRSEPGKGASLRLEFPQDANSMPPNPSAFAGI